MLALKREKQVGGFCCSLWRPSVDSGSGFALLVFTHTIFDPSKRKDFSHQGHVLQGDSTALRASSYAQLLGQW